MDALEVPHYFVCPISLQIMKDPVTAPTGITYDRESIEQWLFVSGKATCPVTNQTLPADFDLTPNHTVRRLIQAWCSANAASGVDRIPTPRATVTRAAVLKLLGDLAAPQRQFDTLRLMATLASDNESNRQCMVKVGVPKSMVSVVVMCTRRNQTGRVAEALRVLHVLRTPPEQLKPLVEDNQGLIDSLAWILQGETSGSNGETTNHAVLAVKAVFEVANAKLLDRLKPEFFKAVLHVLRARTSPQTTKGALQVMLDACRARDNRAKIAEAGAVSELIELELTAPGRRTSELVLGVLDQLCACAEGRTEFARHAAGIAVVTKRILTVSPAADDRAVSILSSVCKYSAKEEVAQEMMRVGAVLKLCLVLQADCSTRAKEKARWVLRLHSGTWRSSPALMSTC